MIREIAKRHEFATFLIGIAAGAGVAWWLLPHVWHWGIAAIVGLVVAAKVSDLAI